MSARSRWLACLAAAVVASSGLPLDDARAAPTEQVHSLSWLVHVDLIDPGLGLDLAYYQALIEARLAEASHLLEGRQGPFDNGCCVELQSVSVSTFGTSGDGLDVVLDASAFGDLQAFGPGSYLIQTLGYCGASIGPLIGCADTPGDFLVVALDAEDQQRLAAVMAHERGHNAGLTHVSSNDCQLMRAGNGGGCLTAAECSSYLAKADTSGGVCACLDDAIGGPPQPDGTACGAGAVCSGGACGPKAGLAGAALVAAGGAGASAGEATDDLLPVSAFTGDWTSAGAIGAVVTGVAADELTGTVYAVESLAGDDALITLDPATGAKLATIGTLAGKELVIALAFDPTGDRLLAIELDDDFFGQDCGVVGLPGPCFSELFEIDPGDASTVVHGELNALIVADGVTGLAWDDDAGVLYGSTRAGLFALDLGGCGGGVCPDTQVDDVFRTSSGLAWEPGTGRLLREGGDGFGVTVIDVIDPGTGAILRSTGVDPFTVGGLAALPVPEPAPATGGIAGAGLLWLLARRRAGLGRPQPAVRRAT